MTQKELYTNIIKAYKVLDEFEKAKMFLEHYIKNVTDEHTVMIFETKPTSELLYDSKKSYDSEIPYFKTNKELGISYGTFKKTYTFNSTEEFCNPENIKLHHIPNWKKQGFAQEYLLQTSGIYKVLENKIR